MKSDNVIRNKSYAFSIRIVKLYKHLHSEEREYVLPKQILRSGTSIGSNIEEAVGGQSKKDFLNKISIAYKEARETHYWLRLLNDTGFIDDKIFNSLLTDCEELLKIITTIQKTLKKQIGFK